MRKRGISAIVATVLIILVTVTGVGIIWVAVLPMIKDQIEFSELSGRVSVVSTGGWTLYDAERGIASVQVKREPDEGVMDRVKVSFLVGGNSVSSSVVAPSSGGTKVYFFDLSSVGAPDSVEVSPIFVSSSGKEKVGVSTSNVKLSSGTISEVSGAVYEVGGDYSSESLGSCLEILQNSDFTEDGVYWISTDGESSFQVYCDMTTDGGGWTLVWIGTGKAYSNSLIDVYSMSIDREDISSGTMEAMQTKLLEKWPYYTEIYYERWLPDSLVGRSYAAPGWAKRYSVVVSDVPTNVNFWSIDRVNEQGWDFVGHSCPGWSPGTCYTTPNGLEKSHIWGCSGCSSNYLWFQDADVMSGSWNGFYPDSTYGYWRISTGSHYNQHWAEYDALSEGDAMPGYGLYVR